MEKLTVTEYFQWKEKYHSKIMKSSLIIALIGHLNVLVLYLNYFIRAWMSI